METISLSPNKDLLAAFVERYRSALAPSKNPYIQHFFRLPGATVSIYHSGKVVLQGEQASEFAAFFGYKMEKSSPNTEQNLPLMGSDEVGNGSYFGGLAVVASLVTPKEHGWLRELGVGDSKTLTDAKIRQLAPLLKESIPHQALLLTPQKYNEVIASGYNAVSVKVALHNQALYLLLQQGAQPEKIVIDAFTSVGNYQKYLKKEKNQFSNPITLEEKAEGKYLAVAVSSIIARALFLENLEKLGKELGMTLPSGAGSKSDQIAASILKRYGRDMLAHVAKLHFKNTEKAEKIAKGKL
ncbi:ribonuclease HIII [Streptococcus massiliensis]|uniref:Ribonuclease HIII n=1 Tax=Streptococcus massiliensis TaxID=313439 RepID=A0A380L1T0_9STRE|nr:ribonuclease HIII [Streptococcus massiliensis]SUN77325.1 ribonuclease HIII [Streptococcus massiliensis]